MANVPAVVTERRTGPPRERSVVRRALAITALLVRLASRPLEVNVEACLNVWRSQPSIVVVMEDPAGRETGLIGRIHDMFPF